MCKEVKAITTVSGKPKMTSHETRTHETTQYDRVCLSSPRKQLAFIKQTKSACISPAANTAGAVASLARFHPRHSRRLNIQPRCRSPLQASGEN